MTDSNCDSGDYTAMAKKRLTISLKRQEAMRVTKVSVGKSKLVYIIVADKLLSYVQGRSRIAYIGTTKKGLARISKSVSERAEHILAIHGVQEFHVRIVTCKPRQRVKTWFKLERAMLLVFREEYGQVPYCNSDGSRMKVTDEFEYFSEKRIRDIIKNIW